MSRFYQPPRKYPNSTCLIVGGGPSLKGFDLSPARLAGFTIAVNNAYRLVPHAEVLFFGDRRWFRWHEAEVMAWPGQVITSSAAVFNTGKVQRMGKLYDKPISDDRSRLVGIDSGCQAVNLAYHFGARKIVLAGFDMDFAEDGSSHFHNDHQTPSDRKNYVDKFTPQYPPLIAALAERGVEVVRCTPSRLDFIPQVDLGLALCT